MQIKEIVGNFVYVLQKPQEDRIIRQTFPGQKIENCEWIRRACPERLFTNCHIRTVVEKVSELQARFNELSNEEKQVLENLNRLMGIMNDRNCRIDYIIEEWRENHRAR